MAVEFFDVFTSGRVLSIVLSSGYEGVVTLKSDTTTYNIVFTNGSSSRTVPIVVEYDTNSKVLLNKMIYYPVVMLSIDGTEILGDTKVRCKTKKAWFTVERFTNAATLPASISTITITNKLAMKVRAKHYIL
jgi:hypothetical protein